MSRFRTLDAVIAPLLVFVCFYVASAMTLGWLRFPFIQWTGLISASLATAASVAILERGRWPLGLFVAPRLAIPEFAWSVLWGSAVIGATAILIVLTTDVHHAMGRGFPWRELVTVFVPAAVHEELLFRGYPFQKLYRRSRPFAILFVAFVFASLHSGNESVTWLGLANIFLGGVLLGLAYERYERLWFPIGLHLAWNIVSGPILGHEVSGYASMETVLVEVERGPEWLTGGAFGIEGSIWITLVEIVAIALAAWLGRRRIRAECAVQNAE